MKKLLFIILAVFVLSLSGMAGATTFEWDLGDLSDLDHNYYYTWGEDDWAIPSGDTVVSASVTFDDIRNYDSSFNDLYMSLLDSALDGTTEYEDGSAYGSYFESSAYTGTQITLNQWEDLPATAQDITYDFDASEIGTLVSYLENDSVFGLGFDPDCHFWNDGVSFTVNTTSGGAPVPEPTTMLLLGCGLAGLRFV
ncbi:MAG: PEP-CTERM sorting domain-containing protein, partial [Deltaproteobacteria bacterium]|nr:PEP-CTERM sorting domain-containing protein [Deltaproteobacteria bacterium]